MIAPTRPATAPTIPSIGLAPLPSLRSASVRASGMPVGVPATRTSGPAAPPEAPVGAPPTRISDPASTLEAPLPTRATTPTVGQEDEIRLSQDDGVRRSVFVLGDENDVTRRSERLEKPRGTGFGKRVQSVFLPEGYPASVSPDYLDNRRWVWGQNVFSAGVVFFNTKIVLAAMGVAFPDPAVAAIGWTAREWLGGAGKFAGAALAKRVDKDPEQWYFFGRSMFQAGMVAESTLGLVPGAFIPVAVASQAMKSAGDTLVAAAGVNIEKHQALAGNIGEVKAKNTNQDYVTNAMGTALGMGLQSAVNATGNPTLALGVIYGAWTLGSLYCAYRASRALQMGILDGQKLLELHADHQAGKALRTPQQLQQALAPWQALTGNLGHHVRFGAGLDALARHPDSLLALRELFRDKNYLLYVDRGQVQVVLRHAATGADLAEAADLAGRIERALATGRPAAGAGRPPGEARAEHQAAAGDEQAALELIRSTTATFHPDPAFLDSLRAAGWDPETMEVHSRVRAEW